MRRRDGAKRKFRKGPFLAQAGRGRSLPRRMAGARFQVDEVSNPGSIAQG